MGVNNPPSPIIYGGTIGKIVPTITAGVISTDSSGVLSSTATTGSGNVVLASAPTMTNPVVGTQSQGDSSTKAASTSYVDVAVANAVAGVNPAVAVQAATTAASDTTGYTYNNGVSGVGSTLTAGSVNAPLVVDGYTFTAIGQRLLVKNNSTAAFNGIYSVTQIQTAILPVILTRVLDYDQPSEMNNTGAIPVINGTTNGTTSWVQTALITTVGTDSLVFVEFTRNPADYLLKSNNLSDVAVKATAFNNLSPMTTGGDLIYGGASGTGTRLANGTSGFVLTSNGGTSAPSWQASGGGGGSGAAGISYYMSANQSVTANSTRINFDTVIYDSGGYVTTGASWAFTAPNTGYYMVAGTFNTGSGVHFYSVQTGSSSLRLSMGTSSGGGRVDNFVTILQMTAGDTFYVLSDSSTTIGGGVDGNGIYYGVINVKQF